jgi:hypothetical protein
MVAAVVAVALLTGCLAVSSFAGDVINKTVWGNPTKGVTISLSPVNSQFKIGDKIEVLVAIKNVGTSDVNLITGGKDFNHYRIAMFDSEGSPVAFSEEFEEFRPWVSDAEAKQVPDIKIPRVGAKPQVEESGESQRPMPTEIKRKMIKIASGQMATDPERLFLDQWFKIEKPGTYTVVVMRRISTWDRGFPISNAVKIEIVK